MTAAEVVKGRWYPRQAPALPGETDETWTGRMLGARGEDLRPYDHSRNRQCSIGFHNECSDRDHSGQCGCPCHDERGNAESLAAEFNQRTAIGTVVSLIECDPPEPDVATTSAAYVDDRGWPVVELDTFPRPVWLSWLRAPK